MKHILEFGLLQSASKDDLKVLKSIAKLLIEHENVCEANELLELAIENDEMEAALLVLNHGGIDGGSKLPKTRMTPIELSLIKGYSLVQQNSSHMNAIYSNGLTLLQNAILNKSIELVEILISNGANVNTKGSYERPLILALENGLADIAKLLIKNGADIESASRRGYTPLHVCLGYGHLEMANFLIAKGANLNALNDQHVTPLHVAVQHNHIEIVQLLLDRNVDPNPETADEYATPLLGASRFGHTKIAKILLEMGAKTNIKDIYGMYPIHHAAYKKNHEILESLLENGANVNERVVPITNTTAFLQWTPLTCAAYNGDIDIAKTLIKYGANLDASAPVYSTPLRTAIDFEHTEIVQLLIQSGACLEGKYIRGKSPEESALANNRIEMLKLVKFIYWYRNQM